ncbi:MAG: lipid II flippase MurJ, partial [bacterium]
MSEAHVQPQSRLSTQTWITASFILVLTTLGSKALGLVRDVLAAKLFGAGPQVDAFMVASTLAAATAGIGSALAATVVPAYRRVLVARGSGEAAVFAGGAVGLTLVLSTLIMGMLVVAPRFFVALVTPSLPAATAELAAELVRWLAGFILGINLFYIFSAVYNA